MRTVIKVFAVLLVFTTVVNAQDFTGIATYKTKRKIDIQLDSTQVNSEMHQKMMEMLKKQFERTFILSFNKEESVYKEEEKLGGPQTGAVVEVIAINTGGSDILYKNTKEERYTNQNDVFGKIFLIKDQLQKEEWQFQSDTKNIGEYTCYKATIAREQPKMVGRISVNGDKDLSKDREPEMETVTVTAWYTPQIPVNNGPANYFGLPGLILEVNDGSETIICSKIVLNPTDKVEISEPKKGKEVTQEEFDKIVEKKLKEMEERYSSERGDGHNIEIKIGG
ncbi:GLPGLI family protein [Mangrovimonas sp. TPBH4]|uniref:GLPGLI family protein n=1 Tax=Mangrovimonas sp. TPBH4 TaxID=1645914 RepID=UPI0006B47D5D|nr:GLPGLI family protein [Mangrovimonas sp. TPBH4]